MRILTPDEIRSVEAAANADGHAYEDMMELAGQGCAQFILRHAGSGNTVILCGKGKNGGDGLVIARILARHGREVTVVNVFSGKSDPLSETMRARLPADVRVLSAEDAQEAIEKADLLVDAIFGIGFAGEVGEPVRTLLAAANAAKAERIAVDVPSGLSEHFTQGQPCFHADRTLTMLCCKPVHVYKPFADLCGSVHVIGIGFDADTYAPAESKRRTVTPPEVAAMLGKRPYDANKGTCGNALLLAGSKNMPGAAVLAATGALYTGAGLVTLAFPDAAYAAIAPQLPECVLLPLPSAPDGGFAAQGRAIRAQQYARCTAAAAGCGMTTAAGARDCLFDLLRHFSGTLVLDADGINLVASHIDILNEASGKLVLTPHPGEMARLTGTTVAAVNADRETCARDFARKHGVVLLLKGANTVIALPDGTVCVNPTGNPGMARGGSGDLLTGMLVSLAAQGLPPADAAVAAAYLHGLAGDFAARTHTVFSATVQRTAACISAALSFVFSEKD